MPRDYIFATMPQFPWYKYPRRKALEMTFGEIYIDLYQQSAKAGHAFTCRFTRSMFDPVDSDPVSDPVSALLPSTHQPNPRCLGDFLKLMGHRVSEISNGDARHVHLTTIVTITEFCCDPEPNSVLYILEASMKLFEQQWQESHIGGEISKFGNLPDALWWTLDHADAKRRGWLVKLGPRRAPRALNNDPWARLMPIFDYHKDDLLPSLDCMEALDAEDTKAEQDADYIPLFQHTS